MSPDSAGSSVSLSPSLDSFWVVVAKNEDGAGIFTRLMVQWKRTIFQFACYKYERWKDNWKETKSL